MYRGEYTTGFIAWGAGQEANAARGLAKCCICFETLPRVQ